MGKGRHRTLSKPKRTGGEGRRTIVRSTPFDPAKRAAYHEAGHAIADVVYGRSFSHVSMEQKRKSLGDGRDALYTDGVVFTPERTEAGTALCGRGEFHLADAVALMAGPVAEFMYVGELDETTRLGASMDFHPIMFAVKHALNISDEAAQESELVAKIAEGGRLVAVDLLHGRWTTLERVAEALHDRKLLTFDEVAGMVALGGA